jgi:hypothetical protein
MKSPSIDCPKCALPLEWQSFNTPDMTRCPSCATPLRVEIFPAFFGDLPTSEAAGTLAVDNDSGCYFHPQKKAIIPCALCGRFICSLCDIELSGQHICPSCFETGQKKHKIETLENHRVLYDDIALALSIIPMIFIWPTIATAPASIYLSIRHWKSPTGIIPRTKVRFIIAIFLSLFQITGWVILISYLATR